MVECICIDAKSRPNEIPLNKWLVEGNKYNVIFTLTVLPQRQLAFHLAEIELTKDELPYEYFLANRFSFTKEALEQLMELIKDCSDTEFSLSELMEQTQLETA
mgnify:CR=1 FL=1